VLNFFYFFGIGILVYLNFNRLHELFSKYGKWVIVLFILCVLRWTYLERFYEAYHANYFNMLVTLLLAFFVFSFAFLPVKKEGYFVQRNDFSYSLYLYHAPVINLIYTYGLRAWGHIIFWPLSITFAILSWYLIEQPFLKTKKTSHAR
jgi:peptidoglycan/LPS O-acetylase OafA/YrhL